MERYHVVIGLAVIQDREFPVIRCDILATDINAADTIAEFMGLRIFEIIKADKKEEYQTYQLN